MTDPRVWLVIIPALPLAVVVITMAVWAFKSARVRNVDADRILLGQVHGIPLEEWAKLTGDFKGVSSLMTISPHVRLLRDIADDPDRLFDVGFLRGHEYFKMADHIRHKCGHFRGAKTHSQIIQKMQSFWWWASGEPPKPSPNLKPVTLSKIKYSDFYEVKDGHHRVAKAIFDGRRTVPAHIAERKTTLIQDLVIQGQQTHGERELYQALPQLEVFGWPVVRRCWDRAGMMANFLDSAGIKSGTILDLACSYGFFLKVFKGRGFTVNGIDTDLSSVQLARVAYGLGPEEVKKGEIHDFLTSGPGKYDVVLLLSILHHYALHGVDTPEAILRQVDKITGKVLFLDTGQNREQWFERTLARWDDEYVMRLVLGNTTFTRGFKLGRDGDNRGKYRDQYNRTMFAFTRGGQQE